MQSTKSHDALTGVSVVGKLQSKITESIKRNGILVLSTLLVLSLLYYTCINLLSVVPSFPTVGSASEIAIPMDPFPEPRWWNPESTLGIKTVVSTKFARFEIHSVKTEDGHIINDWLWADERSHVNILVHLKEEDKYLLFKQKKYGLLEPKLALVGGLFEEGDTPEGCAHRELLEETGLQTDEMIGLGSYRVQVNRGGGMLHAFYAKNCIKSKTAASHFEQDYEAQEIMKLTKRELMDSILTKQEIGEAQWLSVASTALLYEEHKQHHA